MPIARLLPSTPLANKNFLITLHNTKPFPLALCKFPIVNISARMPLEAKPMFEPLVQIFDLPAAQIDFAFVMPENANIFR